MLVRYIMNRAVTTFSATDTAADTLRAFRERGLQHAPVVEEGKVVGVVDIRDLMRVLPGSIAELEALGDKPVESILVGDAMTPDPITVRPNDHVEEAARALRHGKLSGLPVVQAGRLVGMITPHDFFGVLVQDEMGDPGGRLTFLLHGRHPADVDLAALCALHGLVLHSMMHHPNANGGWVITVWVGGKASSKASFTAAARDAGCILVQGGGLYRAA